MLRSRGCSSAATSIENGRGLSADELFALFRASGYLNAGREAALAPTIADIRRTFASVYTDDRSSAMFEAMVARHDGALIGHMSGVRAYDRCWMVQHLVAAPFHHVAHLLMVRGTDRIVRAPGRDLLRIWYQEHKSWPRRVFGGFARGERGDELSELRSFRRVGMDLDRAWPIRIGDCGVVEADEASFRTVADSLARISSPLRVRAEDLDVSGLPMRAVGKAFAATGLLRRREVLLARRDGECLGIALAELASPGLNLYDLLSTFRVHVLPAGAPMVDDVRRVLLGGVARFYRGAGRRIAHGFITDDEVPAFQALGLSIDPETWNCWTFDLRTLLRFRAYVERLFAAVENRRST